MKMVPVISSALLLVSIIILPGCKKADDIRQEGSQTSNTNQSSQAQKTNADGMKDNNFKYCIDGSLYMLNKNTWVATPVFESVGGSVPSVKTCADTQLYSDDLTSANN